MPYHTPDASVFTKQKRNEADSAGSLAISRVKRRAVNPYGFYIPSYRISYEPRPAPTIVLITKGVSDTANNGQFPFYNGGIVTVVAPAYAVGASQGYRFLFDGLNTQGFSYNFNTPQPMVLTITFPVNVFVTKIFLIGRGANATDLPLTATLTIDSVLFGTSNRRNDISNSLGLVSPSYGPDLGIFIQPNTVGTVWRFEFPISAGYTSIGELEMQGYVASI